MVKKTRTKSHDLVVVRTLFKIDLTADGVQFWMDETLAPETLLMLHGALTIARDSVLDYAMAAREERENEREKGRGGR